MNKRGFTLIELLAVIVILVIIALIATPIVLTIIKDSRETAGLRSAEMYLNAVEQSVSIEKMDNTSFNPSICTVIKDGNLECEGPEVKVEVNGEVPKEGSTISFEKGKIKEVTLNYSNNKTIVKDASGNLIYGTEKIKTYINGEIVYFDVTTGEKCTNYTEAQSATGVKSGCMKFYAFNDDGGNTINLLLDHNTTGQVQWSSSGDNRPNKLLEALSSDTSTWLGTETPTNYSLNQSSASSGANYTVDYSNYKARIITAEEIAQITGNTSWDVTNESSTYYFFDSLSTIGSSNCYTEFVPIEQSYTPFLGGCNYGWLYDRIRSSCTNFGCLNDGVSTSTAYWTISSTAFIDYNLVNAWKVTSRSFSGTGPVNLSAGIDFGLAPDGAGTGVRPVIEVLKSKLK